MKILMFGPAYGHNIYPFIDFFEHNTQYKLDFAYSGKNEFLKSTKNIDFIKYSKNPFSLIKLAYTISKNYDFIWYHGAYNLFFLFFIQIFRSSKTKLILNVWGEYVPRSILRNDKEGKKYYKYYNKADIIQCNWYGVYNLLIKKFSSKKVLVFPWGLEKEFLNDAKKPLTSTAQNFIASISKEKINFFYPKSFTEASDHDCIIEAAKLLIEKGINNFCIYFWAGNITRGDCEVNASKKIKKYNLVDIIKIEKHEFLPFSDMKEIWSYMDCGLQISIYDQLSSTLLEPLLLKKEVIATDIEPYQILINKFPTLELKLIPRTPQDLANRMEQTISKDKIDDRLLEQRRLVIQEEFNFENNIKLMVEYYQSLVNKNNN